LSARRTVHKIESQPIGGLKFVRQPNCDLKPAHRDDEFISQFFGFNRANIDTWPKRPHLARQMYHSMTGTKFAFGMVCSATFMKRRI
jgi:hypothetical protein